ncbi:hypothetical protein KFE80_12850 [bacterium SCSIO 12696]|nr:hypothetical protein KFE80_12850 [bacterium SCSIO 12696]
MLRRDYYLKNLGIVQYVPREFCIPDTVSEEPQPAVVELPASPPVSSNAASTPKRPSLAAELDTEPPVVRTPEASAAENLQAEQQPSDDALRFAICHWLVNDTLVFAALEYGENPPQNQHQLLSNILRAIGRLESPLSEPEVVQWPVVPNAPAGEKDAKALFTSLLKGRVQQSESRLVLVMGQSASQWLLPESQWSQGTYSYGDGDCQLVVTPGLGDMLAEPSQKRTTWGLIRPLAGTLPS